MAHVYSYLRFSSARQSTGTSIDRQLDYARRWAVDNGMTLNESLTMRDEGLSAYHQRHIKTGALGIFLAAINAGRIPPGAVLIVEGLDRLSRAEPILAQAQLAQIINADITVVTASDGKQYNREKLKANPMDLVYSLLVMIRAHEESETKSKRVKAAIRKHCEKWLAGQMPSSRIGRPPQWLRFANGAWEFIPERIAGIKHAIDLFQRGWGHFRIAEDLIASGLQLGSGTPNSNQLYRIIRNPALKGEKAIDLDGESYQLANYYPALVNEVEFSELQIAMDQRARAGGSTAGDNPGILTGIGVTYCGYCGSSMVACNVTTRRRKDGHLADSNRRINCSCRAARKECPMPASCSVIPLEQAVMTYCSDQMNLNALLDGQGDHETALRARLAKAKGNVAEIEARIERITEVMLASDDAPASFIKKARDLEAELNLATDDIAHLEHQLLAVAKSPTPAAADAWAALRQGVAEMDYESRLKARKLIFDTFEKIMIYPRGMSLDPDGAMIDLLLVAKGGTSRAVRIKRKTGQVVEGIAVTE